MYTGDNFFFFYAVSYELRDWWYTFRNHLQEIMGIFLKLFVIILITQEVSCRLGSFCEYVHSTCGLWMQCNFEKNICVCEQSSRPDNYSRACVPINGFCDRKVACLYLNQRCNLAIQRCECGTGFSFSNPSERDFCLITTKDYGDIYIGIIIPTVVICFIASVIVGIRGRNYIRQRLAANGRPPQRSDIYTVEDFFQISQQQILPQVTQPLNLNGNQDVPQARSQTDWGAYSQPLDCSRSSKASQSQP